jgi:hypothetical protein
MLPPLARLLLAIARREWDAVVPPAEDMLSDACDVK